MAFVVDISVKPPPIKQSKVLVTVVRKHMLNIVIGYIYGRTFSTVKSVRAVGGAPSEGHGDIATGGADELVVARSRWELPNSWEQMVASGLLYLYRC